MLPCSKCKHFKKSCIEGHALESAAANAQQRMRSMLAFTVSRAGCMYQFEFNICPEISSSHQVASGVLFSNKGNWDCIFTRVPAILKFVIVRALQLFL